MFIGLENINPDNLAAAHKRQNKITEYRKMLLAWKQAKVLTYCGYILGFPNDTPESILHDIRVIQKELPVDLLEFFYLTPLPGSEDHRNLYNAGTWMDRDVNKYDLNHAVVGHSCMSKAEWEGVYRAAWEKDRGAPRVTLEAAMAKAFATEAAQRIVDDAVQILGGRGVLADHPVDRLYRSVRALRIYEGTTEIQHLIIAGQLIK